MDEQPEEPEVVVPEKENKTGGLLLLCGTVLLIAAAIAGHTVVSDNVSRETAFIVLLVAGTVFSVVGLYYFYAKKKNE